MDTHLLLFSFSWEFCGGGLGAAPASSHAAAELQSISFARWLPLEEELNFLWPSVGAGQSRFGCSFVFLDSLISSAGSQVWTLTLGGFHGYVHLKLSLSCHFHVRHLQTNHPGTAAQREDVPLHTLSFHLPLGTCLKVPQLPLCHWEQENQRFG